MNRVISRWQQQSLEHSLAERRVVLLSGARQCGKTTLARQLQQAQPDAMLYRTLDDPTLLAAAQSDPLAFVRHDRQTLIIDEIQRAPDLLPAIKLMVDQDTRPGQYLLTGSASLEAIPTAQESLAGRVARVRLRPLAPGELKGAAPGLLPALLDGVMPESPPAMDRDQLIAWGFRGGYPEALTLPPARRASWHRDYLAALLERDLRDIARIQHKAAMQQLVEALAAWSSQYLDIARITDGLSIRRPTVESYINALEALYLVERVPAWTKTDYGRVARRDKLFITDPGLVAALLNWREEAIGLDPDRLGKLAENWVFSALMPHLDQDADFRLYHYRDWEQRELDFLVERHSDGALLGIEVKASETIRTEHFRHLAWFRDHLVGTRPFVGIVLYSGSRVLSFGPQLWALPFSAL